MSSVLFPLSCLLHGGSRWIPALTGYFLSLSSLVQLEKAVVQLCVVTVPLGLPSDRRGPLSAEHSMGRWRAVPLELECASVSAGKLIESPDSKFTLRDLFKAQNGTAILALLLTP